MRSWTRGVLGAVTDVAKAMTGHGRWVYEAQGRVYAEVRGLQMPGSVVREPLRERLATVPGAQRIELNGALGAVLVTGDPARLRSRQVVDAIAGVERLHTPHTPLPSAERVPPGNRLSVLREAVTLGLNVAGIGLSVASRVLPGRVVPQLSQVALPWAESTPPARAVLERVLGARTADLVLTPAMLVTNTIAGRMFSLVTDACDRSVHLVEERERSRAWAATEAGLVATPGSHECPAVLRPPRPAPLGLGTSERAADVIGLAAPAAYAAAMLTTHHRERARGLLAAATPKASRHGIESFAAALGGTLSRRGVLVLDPAALRRLHRVGTVVLDASLLGNPRPHPLATALVRAARTAGTVLVAGDGSEWRERFGVADVVPGGARLADEIRARQRDGTGIVVVSGGCSEALAAADIGIGVAGEASQPWAADVLAPGIAEACVLLEAIAEARRADTRLGHLAMAGAVVAASAATTGPLRSAMARASVPPNAAELLALAVGGWLGASAGQRPGPVGVDPTPWHTLAADAALAHLDSAVDGLSTAESSRRESGAATREPGVEDGLLGALAHELDTPLTPTLATGAGLSAAVGSLLDAAMIVGALGFNALFGAAERVRGHRAVRDLGAAAADPVRVRRDGAVMEIDVGRLVPGDVIELVAGDTVPADCRLLQARGMETDESRLTGESQLVRKTADAGKAATIADRRCMVYRGTVVAAGRGAGLVVAVGEFTEIGRAGLPGAAQGKGGGARSRLAALTQQTLPLSGAAGAILLAADLIRGRRFADAIGHAVGLAVASIPEGLPFVATSAELAAARRLSRRGVLVRNPDTVEALGRVDVLCFDKTGTLTEGRIGLRQVSDGSTDAAPGELTAALRSPLAAALRASQRPSADRPVAHPTDRAVIEGAAAAGVAAHHEVPGWHKLAELPFEPSRGYHAVLADSAGGRLLSVKGAPEIVLDRCTTWRRAQRDIALDDTARARVERHIDRLARRGYRVLAVAERPARSVRTPLRDSDVGSLRLLGLLALADPVRPAAAESVRQLIKAGIGIVMLTGDHPSTAKAVAAELNAVNGRSVLTGAELDELDDERLGQRLPEVAVFARVTPEQKARIVRVLRDSGRVVAVTGDGANDAPAIRLADVGIALGERATPAAREAADVIVTDDRIETITDAVVEGRAVWSGVRDGVALLVGGNLGEIAFTLGTGLLGGDALNVRQLLLVNLLTDVAPAIAVAVRPPAGTSAGELLAEGPDVSLGAALNRDVAVRAAATAAAATVAWLGARVSGTRGQASSTGLVALVAAQLGQTVAVRGRTPLVLASSLGAFALLAAAVQLPGVNRLTGCTALLPHQWALALGAAGLSTGTVLLLNRLPVRRSGRSLDTAAD